MKKPGAFKLPSSLHRFKGPLLAALGFHALLMGIFWFPTLRVKPVISPIYPPTNLEITLETPTSPQIHEEKPQTIPGNSPVPIPSLPLETNPPLQDAEKLILPDAAGPVSQTSQENDSQKSATLAEESIRVELWNNGFHPLPEYPHVARKFGYEGMTVVRIKIDSTGRVLEVDVLVSSGYAILDKTARNKILQDWRFNPPGREIVMVKEINFSLIQR
ncbi:MAG: hypothetical protein A2Z96_07440 [Spirochaetes bacterium GWB1_48_6]|nr:MAG: hypothetical protein A2Z96_07440 [Spirochaetes bacterium GWB1_48_6]